MPRKPVWLTVELPPAAAGYYYDTGYGTGVTYDGALEHAINNIGRKRKLATGQTVVFEAAAVVSIEVPLTVRAKIVHEYWEQCSDATLHKDLYHVHILCIVPVRPDINIDSIKPDSRYLMPQSTD
jgi:hypothetical protein